MADRDVAPLVRELAAAHGIADEARVAAAHRLLYSKLSATEALSSENPLTRSITTRLERESRVAEANRLEKLVADLSVDPALPGGSSWPVLYVLSSLIDAGVPSYPAGEENGQRRISGGGNTSFRRLDVFDSPQSIPQKDTFPKLPRGTTNPGVRAAPIGNPRVSTARDAEEMPDADDSDDEDHYDEFGRPTHAALRARAAALPDGGRSAAAFALPPPRTKANGAMGQATSVFNDAPVAAVTPRYAEIVLVRDIMLIVQGADGKYIRYPKKDSDESSDDDMDPAASRMHPEARRKRRRALRDLNEVVEILPLPSREEIETGSSSPGRTPIAACTEHFLRHIAELGFLYKVVYRRIKAVDSNQGLVAKNFCNAVDREMELYYRSLAAFRVGAETPDGQIPSLRTVYVWAMSEKPRLRWLARLCDETASLVGGQTVAHLRHYLKSYVSDDIRSMLRRIMARTAAPLDLMLIRWVSEGVLVDPHGEFFIMEDPKVVAAAAAAAAAAASANGDPVPTGGVSDASPASHRVWWGMFKVRREMIPGVLSRTVVENTLVAGKSVAFLRRCCGDSIWVDQDHAPELSRFLAEEHDRIARTSSATDPAQSGVVPAAVSGRGLVLGSGLLDQDPRLATVDRVGELVRRAVRSSSIRLKSLFFNKFDLSHHFQAIRNYLLLSKGDFTQALMDSLAPVLDGDGRILRNNLTGLLDEALRGSSGFNPERDSDIAERLDVRIVVVPGQENIGWDVFSLIYRVDDAPLNTVFSTKVMDAYLRIFRFLWRLKRLDHVLSGGFVELREIGALWRRRRRRNHEIRKREDVAGYNGDVDYEVELDLSAAVFSLLDRAHFVRMKMAHMLQNLQYYCTIEVLEGNWKLLVDQMSRADDIDALIEAHKGYLGTIKDRTLLSERTRGVAVCLEAVLDTMLDYGKTQKSVCMWATAACEESVPFISDVRQYEVDMDRIEGAFNARFSEFLSALKSHSKEVSSCMFLLFRLDYNGFFARQAALLESQNAEQEDNMGDNDPESASAREYELGSERVSPDSIDVSVDAGDALESASLAIAG